jgi:predicted kinase
MRPASAPDSPAMRDEQPTMFLVVGLPGAGKTVRARELAAARRALLLTPDAWMLTLFGRGFQSPQWRLKRDALEGRLIMLAGEAGAPRCQRGAGFRPLGAG